MKECIVIMPIEDYCEGYDEGHFANVYKHVIKPSVKNAGYYPMRADELDPGSVDYEKVINKIVLAPMAIFDLSTWNDRIITGLMIRKAFQMPTVIISDVYTPRIFNCHNIKYLEYKKDLSSPINFYSQSSISECIKVLSEMGDHSLMLN